MYIDFKEYSELYHYGILGMKWGVRRFQDKNGDLTIAGRKRYDVGSKRDSSNDKVLDKQDIVNVGNSIILTHAEQEAVDIYTQAYTEYSKTWDSDTASDFAMLDTQQSQSYKDYVNFGTNCPNCALAVELKKRGMEVRPKGTGGLTAEQIHDVYAGEKTKTCFDNKSFFDSKNYGKPGDHGQIFGYYPDSVGGGGHTLNYTVLKDGTVQIEDAQSGVCMTLAEYQAAGYSMCYFMYGEIMNLTKAEIDMEYAAKQNMVDTSSYRNGNDMKIRQYKEKVNKYLKSGKLFDKIRAKFEKGRDIVKRLFGF